MKCPSPIALSRALAEGLDDTLRAHLDACPICSGTLALDAALVEHARNLPVVVPDASRSANVRAGLLAASSAPAPLSLGRPWRAWLAATGAMVAVAAVLAFIVLRPPRAPQHTYAATILPHEGAALLRTSAQPDETVRLVAGTATFQVASLEPGHRFRVITGDAEIEGSAAFDVSVDRDHVRSVRVVQGRVVVRASGEAPRTIVEGERWEVQFAAHTPPEESPTQIAAADTAIAPAAKTHVDADVETGAQKRGGGRTAESSSSPTAPKAANATTSPPSATSTARPAASPSAGTAAITTGETAVAGIARPKRSIEVLFDQGWSDLAAGNAAAAAVAFERAAQAAPDDPLAEDAWFWRASALVRAKSSAASTALDYFLAHYPRSPRVGEASAMLGWIIIERDLDRAESLFHAAEQDRVAAVRASAAKGLAAVAARRRR